ncbi:MAG: pirin family protein [Actinomycetota bacterium]
MAAGVELQIEPRVRRVGAGSVNRLLPFRTRRMVGPFIFADLFGPEELAAGSASSVDAHPHIGLSTVTYLLAGRMVHRDSTGAVAAVEPGAVNWMTAGSGVAHTERSHPDDVPTDRDVHGFQTWVALPDGDEDVAPSFQHAPAEAIPTLAVGASTVRVAVGTGWGVASPVAGSSPLILAELRLDGDDVPIDVDHAERAVLAIGGSVSLNGYPLPEGHLAVLQPGYRSLVGGDGVAMILGGEPVGPRRIWWNFVHSDPERIEAAKAEWTEQRFPLVPGDHDPWIPLPALGG